MGTSDNIDKSCSHSLQNNSVFKITFHISGSCFLNTLLFNPKRFHFDDRKNGRN